ncbi:similar to Saccharomyces cerevisiae YMR078C CTF18 Subunit of a complex with Ctf8p that shares some subunits with Replication Factor C and is required for sister chromatid cohesion [Maudiozyma barnettii]|uniref:Similar to Saccharomyces cerevisiae YMR078C CTF18 Subunit of a complex with Ctf8p that shares some subunits with Replication Factor C and is required for sister chromatid cohesion n=1 Tax=Maudiozyma barnettii TaxID=61262 RepID=A0A8H2VK33_9SACH|nr:Ctf18p [Kazachstania barnettii]CAB4256881.1 similar to Saccharomyces cerevisiae YMR078C CTF18 Subunit of a complex with Ctf8p that shares some subunits with Replication Factor C and is required for sister chromatid cohesion [Kazachstania barnettii]CAD1785300.1 similar to Saccharomyces cerevisiae YMR078C CTF18 Subunit of a complex with Ctf8p that shares some subunits with Replication Factor C and is required for sister chromatid cohesion [Kazachstania barnettii]
MSEVPVSEFTFGKSLLFDFDGNADAEGTSNDTEQLLQFISGDGLKVSMKKKKKEINKQNGYGDDILGLNQANSEWKQDDSYGINISALLDRIEARSNDTEVTSTATTHTHHDHDKHAADRDHQLWVERWRPKNFLDLVGNEKTNRRILKWLRDWSPVVFKEQIGKIPSFNEKDQDQEPDPLMRPRRKILLIHGSPGIGKTSVAHVVCKQAGFQVTEINASDERAGQVVKDKIHNTLFNKTLHKKPVCLVADEIDGSVENGFVRVLIDIINKDIKATNKLRYMQANGNNNNTNHTFKSKGKKKKKSANLLLRPIIAICNNIYAPALEKLKPYCEIVAFKRPSDSAIQERLLDICDKEKLQLSVKTLNDLIDLSQGDVRNCINNLQFMATQNKFKNVNPKGSSENGNNSNTWESSSKDLSMSWYLLVNRLFKKDPHSDVKEQFKKLLHEVEMNGNYDRILQGCYTLFPAVKYSDRGVQKPKEIADWLYFHDLMNQSLYHHNGELIRYSAIVPLVFFQNFGDIANKEDLRIKNIEFQTRDISRANLDIANLIISNISTEAPTVAAFINKNSLIFEILPYLDYMISSDLTRTKNLKTKNIIAAALLAILKEFHLELLQIQQEASESRPVLGISPPIDKIVLLDPHRMKELITKRPLTYNLLLAKYQEQRVLKRHISETTKEKEVIEENKNKMQKTNANSIEFFKNQYENINSTQQQQKEASHNANSGNQERNSTETHDELRIWVKYKAGFSNAVRKNVSWDALWH